MAKFIGWRPLTSQEKQEIVQRYVAGEPAMDLMVAYHRDKSTIRKVLTDAGLTVRPRGYPKGTQWTPEHRAAHKLATSTPEFAEMSRQALLARLPRMRESPAVNSQIERRLHDALIKAGIGFTSQSLLLGSYLVDIEISQVPVVIEADGSQHQLREQKAKDAIRDAALAAAGYRVFRFTGSQINGDSVACVGAVIAACGLVPDEAPVFDIRTGFSGELHPHWKGGKREFTCDVCGTAFLSQPAHRPGPNYYCGTKCAGAARRGKALTAEHRANIAAAALGKKRGPYQNKRESALHGDMQRPAEMTGPAA